MGVLIVWTCFVCPVMQMFDHWDHELQTGRDTESTFVVLAVSVGAAIVFAQKIVRVARALPVRAIRSAQSLFRGSLFSDNFVTTALSGAGPPSAILRI